ncbi:MAG: cytochrome c, partial [Candidatus Wallbacteria bacterium]|nr:cytochrome c [Candidatus Wallbacteria bacterium]
AVATALLALTGESPPSNYVIPAVPPARFEPGGEFGRLLKKFRCLSCHVIHGAGYNLSTVDLTAEGSRARKDWIRQYLLIPYSLRPVLEERMPVFRMTAVEAEVLSDYISKVFVDDAIPDSLEPEPSAAEAQAGRKLFDERGCIACHILGKSGGYVGPSLNGAGLRLKAGFIYRWVLSPKSLKPGTRDPDQKFSEEEARTLTAFLLQQKAGEWLKGPAAPANPSGEQGSVKSTAPAGGSTR